jgi:galactokinase
VPGALTPELSTPLSKNFTLKELVRSVTAERDEGLKAEQENPPPEVIGNLQRANGKNLIVRARMADAIRSGDYAAAGRALSGEFELRGQLMDQIVPEEDRSLVTAGRERNCGVRFAGQGGGGSIWAIGEAPAIAELRHEWTRIITQRGSGLLLPTRVARNGVIVSLRVRCVRWRMGARGSLPGQ